MSNDGVHTAIYYNSIIIARNLMSRYEPPARLDPEIYSFWLDENPKGIQGGELKLVENNKPPQYENDVKLPSHHVSTQILDSPHSENLQIYGFPHRYNGFKIVVKDGQGYLLMAHELHRRGSFKTDEGRTFENHPHFHQVNYDHRKEGIPGTRHIVPPNLHTGISPAALLDLFKNFYHFDDESSEPIQTPQIKETQKILEDFS